MAGTHALLDYNEDAVQRSETQQRVMRAASHAIAEVVFTSAGAYATLVHDALPKVPYMVGHADELVDKLHRTARQTEHMRQRVLEEDLAAQQPQTP